MKYDEGSLIGSQFRKRENVTYGKPIKARKLPGLLDIFIVQAAVCLAITVAVAVARFAISG